MFLFQQEVKSPPVERSEAYDFESTKAGKGAVTSQYYRTFNIPERFNNPGMFSSVLQIRQLYLLIILETLFSLVLLKLNLLTQQQKTRMKVGQ